MGHHLEDLVPHFQSSKHLLGCLAHVINLAARAGLDVFSKHLSSNPSRLPNNLATLIDKPELEDTRGALGKIDSLTKVVKHSSERSRGWSVMASSTQGIMKPLCLITDVSTRWNSMYYQLALRG